MFFSRDLKKIKIYITVFFQEKTVYLPVYTPVLIVEKVQKIINKTY